MTIDVSLELVVVAVRNVESGKQVVAAVAAGMVVATDPAGATYWRIAKTCVEPTRIRSPVCLQNTPGCPISVLDPLALGPTLRTPKCP